MSRGRIAGHKDPKAPDGPECLAFTRSYLEAFDQVLATSRSADEIIARIKAQFPGLNGLEEVLVMAAGAAFPAKVKG